MTNYVGVAMENSIITLKYQGWSNRRIAYATEHKPEDRKCLCQASLRFNAGPNPPTGNSGPPILCLSHQSRIKEMLELELSVKRIYQDLSGEYGFSGSYDSVKRFIRRQQSSHPYPVCRIEKPPGKEVQIDFGSGVPSRYGGFRLILSR